MRLVTFAGPPSSGKTSVILRTVDKLRENSIEVGLIKFDCLHTEDDIAYEKEGLKVKKALSISLCPDHYFANNIEDFVKWAVAEELDMLITESAGLCNRCSPFIIGIQAVCVVDNLSGINAPKKIGPMLTTADIVVVTKSDLVSQAEREVFAAKINAVNPAARIIRLNGLNGQGSHELAQLLLKDEHEIETLKGAELRYDMPVALCSFCFGNTKLGMLKDMPRRL